MNLQCLKLCLVTHFQNKSFEYCKSLILNAIKGGVTSIQLREKNKELFEVYDLALKLKSCLTPLNIPLIINDHIQIAKAIDAEGVHLGQSDISPNEARKLIGSHKIIGLSIETYEELEIANQLTCIDYVAASAVFPSKTKSNCKTIWGIEGLRQIIRLSKHPVVAIGGIDTNNIRMIFESGVCGAAVVNAIHDSVDPKKKASQLLAHACSSQRR